MATRLMTPGVDPLMPKLVVVQGPGMERWIAQTIARDYGVLANTLFPFPRGFLDRIFAAIPESRQAKSNAEWDVPRLTWRIARHLAAGRGEADFEPLARYLDAADGDWRLIQLAQRIANLLDQYITYRPEWVAKWARGSALPKQAPARWQARLFRDVYAEIGGGHVADQAFAFEKALASKDLPELEARLAMAFGDAVEIFAISTLPPLYLSVIHQLARICDVHLSVLSPSRHYWADLWRETEHESAPSSESKEDRAEKSVFDLGQGNSVTTLLAGLGRLGADFQRNLEETSDLHVDGLDLFESSLPQNRSPSLLERLQHQLLELEEPSLDSERGAENRLVLRTDNSIRIHICHGPRRELEVVEASLREAFEADETLMPEDVLVMAPNIDEIAPDIVAVFGASSQEARAIPYRIADRGAFRRSKVARAFRDFLDLLGGRALRSEIFDWLANEPVAARFGLDPAGLETLVDWSQRAGIRFGLDEAHRERMGLARERAHSFSGGLDRLALAHAVGGSEEIFEGSAAVPLRPQADPALLGALGEIESILREAFMTAAKPQTVRSWCFWLGQMLDRLFDQTDGNAHEHASIREALKNLSDASNETGFGLEIPFGAIRESLAIALESSPVAQPFLSGGVTFCELVPLRAIPFRVIVILGMSDDAFPRGRPAAGFDLMAREPRAGDRTTRNDDRYLFLEAILSARDQLVMTVPGRDVRDGRDLPPSVVLSELLDMLDDAFVLEPFDEVSHSGDPARRLREWLMVAHPLQASSPRYFEASKDLRLVGRDEEAFRGAQARSKAVEADGGSPRRFLADSGAAVERDVTSSDGSVLQTLALEEMVRRILRSTRTFAREDLHLRLPRPEASVEDLDPIELDGLSRYGLADAMLAMLRGGVSPEKTAQRLFAHASVPVGVAGRLSLAELRTEVETIAEIGTARSGGEGLDDFDFRLALHDSASGRAGELVGRLDQLWPGGRIQLGFTKLGRRREFDVWIRHLVLCTLAEEGADLEPRSVFVGRPDSRKSDQRVVVFEAVADARQHLTRLFTWISAEPTGLLPFFPKSSWEFARRALDEKYAQAWQQAHQTFEGGDGFNRTTPESQEEFETARIWEGWSPLASAGSFPVRLRFEELATTFFEPLIKAREVSSR